MRWQLFVVTPLIAAAAGFAWPTTAAAADTYRSRAERWEFTIEMRYVDEKKIDFTGGSEVDTNSDIGWGFGVGYNFNDHLALGVDFGWNSPTYDATINSTDTPPTARRTSAELQTSSIHLNLIYNFIAGPVTPFVSGGIGSTYIDTNVASGPPGTSCWWDPWYGYVCYGYQPTYSANHFSYNATVGVRWDINQSIFLRAAVGSQWIDIPNAHGDPNFIVGRMEIGFSY